MASRQTMFFATIDDIQPVLEAMENAFNVEYYKTGLFDELNSLHYTSIFEKTNLGFTDKGHWMSDDNFLVVPQNLGLIKRTVPQIAGGIKYALDQSTNAQSVCLQLGGIYAKVENVMVAGKVATISEEVFSMYLYNFLSRNIKKAFEKINRFYVGQGAMEKLRLGYRLVLDEKRRKEFDLTLN